MQQEFWYLPFHRLPLADELIDGRPEAVRSYLRHFLTHWSGPDFAGVGALAVAPALFDLLQMLPRGKSAD
jgi:hypothetical protein